MRCAHCGSGIDRDSDWRTLTENGRYVGVICAACRQVDVDVRPAIELPVVHDPASPR